jgi:hypothetical protein
LQISRRTTIVLALLLVVGFFLGRTTTAIEATAAPRGTASPSLRPEPAAPVTLPVVDVDGSDVRGLPRYPGSVRTRSQSRETATATTTNLEYLARASLEDVRSFYRQLFADYGWTVIDLELGYGELKYLIANDIVDGAVDIESRGGDVVEIDLETVTPLPSAAATEPPKPPVAPQPAATPQPTAHAAPAANPPPARKPQLVPPGGVGGTGASDDDDEPDDEAGGGDD